MDPATLQELLKWTTMPEPGKINMRRIAALAGLMLTFAGAPSFGGDANDEGWSGSQNGLQARISLSPRPKTEGPRRIVPYIELRNTRDSNAPLRVRCDPESLTLELVDAQGRLLREGVLLERSGPHTHPGTVSIPYDSSLRVSLYCSHRGVPPDAPAVIPADTGAWILTPEENGQVFLRARLKAKTLESDRHHTWSGDIVTQTVVVKW